MKLNTRSSILLAALALVVLTGCAAPAAPAAVTEAPIVPVVAEAKDDYQHRIYTIDPNAVEDTAAVEIPDESVPMASSPAALNPSPENPLTKREAEAIAIQHAGLTHQDVSFLFTKYEDDDGIPLFEVNFRSGGYEYEFEIHTETGEILSFDKESILLD